MKESRDSEHIKPEDYNYHLPEERIARYPLKERDKSKLLIYKKGEISHDRFYNLPSYLSRDNLLVFNNTRVIQARLFFEKETGARIEIFLLEPVDPPEFSAAFSVQGKTTWRCMSGNLKKWKKGALEKSFSHRGKAHRLYAELIDKNADSQKVLFSWEGNLSFGEVIEKTGVTPLPPYIQRKAEEDDKVRYQTVYSKNEGSVAAPTAGLHFTGAVFEKLREKGACSQEVTLHVGAGTFQPVKAGKISDHQMHPERFSVKTEVLSNISKHSGKIIAVGTTSLRTLETLYWLGVKLSESAAESTEELTLGQWECYNMKSSMSYQEALKHIEKYAKKNGLKEVTATTRIIIVPGYRFKSASGLITNFHLPKSTLLLLIAAFTGGDWKRIYQYALENEFRFLSYGDSSLLMNC